MALKAPADGWKVRNHTRGVVGVEGVPGTLAISEEREEKSKAGGDEAADIFQGYGQNACGTTVQPPDGVGRVEIGFHKIHRM